MIKIEFTDNVKGIEAEFLNEALYLGFDTLSKLVIVCEKFNKVVPLDKMEFFRPGIDASYYEYNFSSKDGREWNQTLKFIEQEDSDPVMSINMSDWKMSEFVWHRDIRDEIIRLRANNTLDKLETIWS